MILSPDAWKKIRRAESVDAERSPLIQPAVQPPSEEIQKNWQEIGMGGMFAFLLFFIIFLIVYLNMAG